MFTWDTIVSNNNLTMRRAKKLWTLRVKGRSHSILLKVGMDDEWYADFEKSRASVWQHLPGVTSEEEAKAVVELLAKME